MASHSSPKRALDTPAIPDRLYFKIGDVARICNVETYVLRFWETQFPQLKPNKGGTGQRLYRRRDVEIALEIKKLVHADGYTLSGARQALSQVRRADTKTLHPVAGKEAPKRMENAAAVIGHARAELREIASLLADPQPRPTRRRPRIGSMEPTTGSLFPA